MKTCILLILTLLPQFLFSQSKITGRVTGANQKPLAFANVELLNVKDTTRIVAGGITDLKGKYIFQNISPNNYFIKVIMLGYKTSTAKLTVSQNNVVKNIILKPLSTSLKEVSIKGKSINNEINKTDYYITTTELKEASSGFDLLENIPKLRIDKINYSVSTLDGRSVKIMINGLNATVQDLIGLRPDKIIKVEYYDIPPARFAGSGFASVINITTKKSLKGGNIVVSLQNSSKNIIGNDEINLKYNRKHSQFGFYYYLKQQNFSQVVKDSKFNYSLQGNDYQELRKGFKSPFGYTQNNFSFDFINRKDNDYTFRINLSPIYSTGCSISNYDFIYNLNNVPVNGKGKAHESYQFFTPHADVYFLKHLPKKQTFIVDAVVGYYKNNNHYNRQEIAASSDTVLMDTLFNRNIKRSIITEALYTKKFKKMSATFGLRYKGGALSQKVNNLFDNSDYEMRTSEKYAYSEIIGRLKKFSYQVNMGLSQNRFTDNDTPIRYSFLAFRPLLRLSYRLSNKSTLTCYYRQIPYIPTLSELSLNQYYIDKNIVYKGNPNLVPYNEHHYSIKYSLNLKRFFFSTQCQYYSANHVIQKAYSYANNYILYSSGNQGLYHYFSVEGSLNFHPFKTNWLRLVLSGALYKNQVWYNTGNESSLVSGYFYGSIFFNYKRFSLEITTMTNYKSLENQEIMTTPGFTSAVLKYKYKNLDLLAGIWCIFSNSLRYTSQSVGGSIVNTQSSDDYYDYGRLCFIGLNYNLNFGKHFKGGTKRINNRDTNTGSFKVDKFGTNK